MAFAGQNGFQPMLQAYPGDYGQWGQKGGGHKGKNSWGNKWGKGPNNNNYSGNQSSSAVTWLVQEMLQERQDKKEAENKKELIETTKKAVVEFFGWVVNASTTTQTQTNGGGGQSAGAANQQPSAPAVPPAPQQPVPDPPPPPSQQPTTVIIQDTQPYVSPEEVQVQNGWAPFQLGRSYLSGVRSLLGRRSSAAAQAQQQTGTAQSQPTQHAFGAPAGYVFPQQYGQPPAAMPTLATAPAFVTAEQYALAERTAEQHAAALLERVERRLQERERSRSRRPSRDHRRRSGLADIIWNSDDDTPRRDTSPTIMDIARREAARPRTPSPASRALLTGAAGEDTPPVRIDPGDHPGFRLSRTLHRSISAEARAAGDSPPGGTPGPAGRAPAVAAGDPVLLRNQARHRELNRLFDLRINPDLPLNTYRAQFYAAVGTETMVRVLRANGGRGGRTKDDWYAKLFEIVDEAIIVNVPETAAGSAAGPAI